jgi:hypothetical protein
MNEEIRISRPDEPFGQANLEKLQTGLGSCPDLAFAYLAEVEVPESGHGPGLVLFAWLNPAALGSLRAALNLVSETVAGAIPRERYLDVVILNSAPELLPELEQEDCLLVEVIAEERRSALEAVNS